MKAELAALVEELQRLKRAGVTSVTVADESLAQLRQAVAKTRATDAPEPASAKTMPPPTPASAPPVVRAVQEDRPAARGAAPAPAKSTAGFPPPPVIALPAGTKRERWEWLRQRVLECPVCRAHTHGECRVVFGVGNIDADIFFCGEAPGGEEEIQGEPFVGPAGQLLTKMIAGMGLKREDVYIGNILNWRPEMEGRQSGRSVHQTGNRPPTEEEMRFCLPYLRAQVEVVQPKALVALGATAAQGLLGFGAFKSLGAARGRWHDYMGIPLMVTYHPSYLLRYADQRTKRLVWEDLLQVMEKVGLPISEKQRGYYR